MTLRDASTADLLAEIGRRLGGAEVAHVPPVHRSSAPLTVAYVGNFGPPASTENEIRRAWEHLGHRVLPLQEESFGWRPESVPADADFVLWTHTYDYGPPSTWDAQRRFLDQLRRRAVPVVGQHLDLWWGLARAHRIHEEPYFGVDLLCTADGGNDDRWAEAGVEHVWFPPAVSEFECEPAEPDERFASQIAFVGSWANYHPEHPRMRLVAELRRRFGPRIRFWPEPGQPAVRGLDLRRLYASVDVVVGDSCLVPRPDGTPARRYVSDRVPETLGRGGFLVHPGVEGVTDGTLYRGGQHLATFPLGDYDALEEAVEEALAREDDRRVIAEQGRRQVLAHHTYTCRARELIEVLRDRHLLAKAAA